MNILVCISNVPDTTSKINFIENDSNFDTNGVQFIINPNDELNSDFPLILSTGRLLEHWHTGTMTRRAVILNELEPDPMIFMNQVDSNFYNLDLNKSVIIETRRGKLSIKIRHDDDLLPGMIFLPFCFKEAAANILTNSDLDPIGKIPELKFSAARVFQN